MLTNTIHTEIGNLPIWTVIPFIGILLSIAIVPLINDKLWHHNFPKVSAFWGILGLSLLFWQAETPHLVTEIKHVGLEFFSFISLIGSLYVIALGIYIEGDLRAHPVVNATIMLVGSVLANLMATTGAAMILIPFLVNTNIERKNIKHTIMFFIFTVANTGGSLTPVGDPPLFLGFLKGVPFLWTLTLIPNWAFTVGAIIVVYLIVDTLMYNSEPKSAIIKDETQTAAIKIHGGANFFLVLAVIASVIFLHEGLRELVMIGSAIISLIITPIKGVEGRVNTRKKNEFTWFPVKEVAILFAGIFVTMIPALAILKSSGASLGVDSPIKFFFATGALSAFLDNAPTYLVFLSTGQGIPWPAGSELIVDVPVKVLAGISTGAVFFGAMTYIGNAPNFMVKSYAESRGIEMPSFFGYMLWSVPILGIIYLAHSYIFLG
ncbi:sodium:proton antiporter [Candidatus Gracilibacteria bacterium]|nr:sodium:proton antiporter [Candidatus Gracilibacteria bacterium]